MTTAYGIAALTAELKRLGKATEGTRNDTLNRVWFRVSQLIEAGHLERADAEARVLSTARQIGLPDGEARATMRSASNGARERPRDSLPDPNGSSSPAAGGWLDGLARETPATPTPFGQVALTGELHDLRQQPSPEQLRTVAAKLAKLASGGHLDGAQAAAQLAQTAREVGMSDADIAAVLGSPAPVATVVTLSNVTPERVAWLWPAYLPRGKLVMLDGDPGAGKSTLTLDWAARVSTGAAWPDGQRSTGAADVLVMSAEDGLADTIAPRLAAAGADRRRVHALTEVTVTDDDGNRHQRPVTLPRDLPVLERVITERGAALVVVDVLMAYLAGKVDSHRDQDVRVVLHELAAIADRTGATIVLLRHLRKGGGKAVYAGGGSIGIIGAARAGFAVGPDPDELEGADDPSQVETMILACSKMNVGRRPGSLKYRVVEDSGYGCGRIVWGGQSAITADKLTAPSSDREERSKDDECASWLIDWLTDRGGQAPKSDVIKAARAEGFTGGTLDRAKVKARIMHTSSGFPRRTHWELSATVTPGQDDDNPPGVTGVTVLTSGNAESQSQSHLHVNPGVTGATEGQPAACQCETPRARQGSEGRWSCATCGRQLPTA